MYSNTLEKFNSSYELRYLLLTYLDAARDQVFRDYYSMPTYYVSTNYTKSSSAPWRDRSEGSRVYLNKIPCGLLTLLLLRDQVLRDY